MVGWGRSTTACRCLQREGAKQAHTPPPNLGVVAPAGVALKVPAAADGVERVALGVRVRLVGVGPEQRLEAVHVHHGALVTPEDLGEGGET